MPHSHESEEEDEVVEIPPPAPANAPTAATYPSICSSLVAKKEANRYKVPPEYALNAPTPEQRAHAPPPGYAAIYIQHLRHGLRLPLPPLVAAVLAHYQIALAQLHPNCIITLLVFDTVCKRLSVAPTAALFRHFFRLRKNFKTEGWYTFQAKEPKVVSGKASSARGWKKSFLFFKTAAVMKNENENLCLSWNFSPDLDPLIPDNQRPDDETVRKILDHVKGSPERKSAAVDQMPLGSEEEEELMVIKEDSRMACVSKACTSKKATKATVKPNSRPKRMAESLIKPAKSLKGPTGKKCEVKQPSLPSLKDVTSELEQFACHKDKDIATLEAEVSRLQGFVDDRGPLLKEFTQKLLRTQGFASFIYELTMPIKRLGHHEAAQQIRSRFPAIPEEALVGLEDPLASYKVDSMFFEMVQNGAFRFPLLDHLMSLQEIPTSSELKDLDVDEDKDALIAPSPPHGN